MQAFGVFLCNEVAISFYALTKPGNECVFHTGLRRKEIRIACGEGHRTKKRLGFNFFGLQTHLFELRLHSFFRS
jgi:hypothetical protein